MAMVPRVQNKINLDNREKIKSQKHKFEIKVKSNFNGRLIILLYDF